MQNHSRAVGARIRLYRQIKKLTLIELAEKVHKSKSTISKYETGEIVIDIETLYELAAALDVEPAQLLDIAEKEAPPPVRTSGYFFPDRNIFLYFYDGRSGRIIRNLLEIGAGEEGRAALYHDLPSFSRLEACRNLYIGTEESFDTVTNFYLTSQSNRIERISLCAANPFDRSSLVPAMLSGLSRYPLLPVSIKCILSPVELPEDEALKKVLLLSQKDLKLIRSFNMFALEPLE